MMQYTDDELTGMIDECDRQHAKWGFQAWGIQDRLRRETNVYIRSKLDKRLEECYRMLDALNAEFVELSQECAKRGIDV